MQISSEKPRYDGLHLAQIGSHFAKNGSDKVRTDPDLVCTQFANVVRRCSDAVILSVSWELFYLPKRSVALTYYLAQSLPSSNTKFVFGLHLVRHWFTLFDVNWFVVGLHLVCYQGLTLV